MASPTVPPPGSLQFKLVRAFVDLNVRVYRLTGGRLGGNIKGAPVLLLDHLGRKTGRARTTPVLYLRDGADLVIVRSRGGSDAMSAWFFNLMSSRGFPDFEMEIVELVADGEKAVVHFPLLGHEPGRLAGHRGTAGDLRTSTRFTSSRSNAGSSSRFGLRTT
jgi:hypothetical protein